MKNNVRWVLLMAAIAAAGVWTEINYGDHEKENKKPLKQPAMQEESSCKNVLTAENSRPDTAAMNELGYTPQTETFRIDPREDNLVTGSQGTQIFIPGGSFDLPEGYTGPLDIHLEEYLDAAALFKAQLTTVSNGEALVSGGTVHLTASCNGNEVDLKKGNQVALIFKKDETRTDNMMTFYGNRTANGTMNWPRFAPSWTEYFVENGYEKKYLDQQDTLFPQVKAYRDSAFARMNLSTGAMEWLRSATAQKRQPKFYLVQHDDHTYRLEQKDFNFCPVTDEIRSKAVTFFAGLVKDTLLPPAHRNISFSPVIEKKPFYYSDKELMQKLVAKLKGDTSSSVQYLAQFAITHYILSATEMGYINCDRFYDYKYRNQEMLVKVPAGYKGKIQMMIPAVNGVYPGQQINETTWAFSKLPRGLPYTLLAFSPRGGEIQAHVQKGRTASKTLSGLAFRSYSTEEFMSLVEQAGVRKG